VTGLLAAVSAATVLSGLLLVLAGLRPVAADQVAGQPTAPPLAALRSVLTRLGRLVDGTGASSGRSTDRSADVGAAVGRRRRVVLLLALVGGALGWAATGLAVLMLAVPAAAIGLPRLLGTPSSAAHIDRLEGLEEWTRNLAGVLAVGVGLEQAITASLRSTPATIRPQVATLVARLAARWDTAAALRAFADDLDDATGDLVAASLILSAHRRGAGLVAVLDGLAASVADDVRTRRAIEADRAKPRSTARAVTGITLAVLVLLAMNKTYVEPYTSGLGQGLLALLLSAYVAALIWMRHMTLGRPTPRLLTAKTARDVPAGPPGDRASDGSVAPPQRTTTGRQT
jgi:Flp pilus assembly protein TadB